MSIRCTKCKKLIWPWEATNYDTMTKGLPKIHETCFFSTWSEFSRGYSTGVDRGFDEGYNAMRMEWVD